MAEFTYDYPAPVGGYVFTLLSRCEWEVGVKPSHTFSSGGSISIVFAQELTAPQKTLLDTLMSNNPTYPPTPTGQVFKIKDIWENRVEIQAALPQSVKIYFTESVIGSGKIDEIQFHFPASMNNAQRNQVKTVFAGLITEA